MQAAIYTAYGSADEVECREVPTPTPGPGEVLVKVHAASANSLDWRRVYAIPALVRFMDGLQRPKNTRLGADFAGRVAAVGPGVTAFAPGDAVFGDKSASGMGAFAEYVCASADAVTRKPDHATFEQAAALGVAAVTALQGLRGKGQLRAGQSVLVNGAGGGVGGFAVQLAKALGAGEVTAVTNARNLDLVRTLGADRAVDYGQTDFTREGHQYDLIVDVSANRAVGDYARALRPGGRCVVIGFTTLSHLAKTSLLGPLSARTRKKWVGQMGSAVPNQGDMALLADLLAAGKLAPAIDRRFPLAETASAIRYIREGHTRGKVIITVAGAGEM